MVQSAKLTHFNAVVTEKRIENPDDCLISMERYLLPLHYFRATRFEAEAKSIANKVKVFIVSKQNRKFVHRKGNITDKISFIDELSGLFTILILSACMLDFRSDDPLT
ncbi:hypothetical protein AVEN_100504-1 [Araneus ventricosus]|uniref:Uncharacterized protein n=1 Tax=Araneus ventricosus TaxID=182803 RepID=A0A4Y2SDF0_ARAVE|nr:hypothetical protein AVEN_100504-1 [Araneus ventricosus]